VPQPRVFLDTSFILALENRDDPFHERAKQVDRELIGRDSVLVLHWGILLEIGDGYARVDRREKGLQLLETLRRENSYHSSKTRCGLSGSQMRTRPPWR
jgi:predicted nucleic acid-binding protein